MITLVDYGLGNIRAFQSIYNRLNIPCHTASTAEELDRATHLLLPGVGAFDWAMTLLNESGMRPRLEELVKEEGVPVLGVCVGMQMLAAGSEEGFVSGLDWIPGDVVRFTEAGMLLPHMGWNDVSSLTADPLFKNIEAPRFYFLHSYHFVPRKREHVLATTDYQGSFVSCVRSGNVFGTQFHPEKSHGWGISLLKNFAELEY